MAADYYKCLEISKNASASEIRKAYREKARQWHPDLCKLPEATDKFIELTEAYEYLLKKTSGVSFQEKEKSYKKSVVTSVSWNEIIREAARERARIYARMKYQEFLKSPIYKTTKALNKSAEYIMLLFAIIIPLLSNYGLYNNGIYYLENNVEQVDWIAITGDAMLTIIGITIIILFVFSWRRRGV